MAIRFLFLLLLISVVFGHGADCHLYRSSRWIVDDNGRRVKFACVNWASHVDTMIAEGLNKRALDDIPRIIQGMGFNCVRLTWALYMFTDSRLGSTTARQSLQSLHLDDAISGMKTYNPQLLDVSVIDIFKTVVAALDRSGLMIILDNHVSRPEWCCSSSDGNGFFGDKDFNPDLWISGLRTVASTFNSTCNVVGMSLRNELRGPRQSVNDWYKYMQKGAQAVHETNPKVLVIMSGLDFDTRLSFLQNRPLTLDFQEKVVFEMHWYAFTDGQDWANGNANQVCASVRSRVMNDAAFLLQLNKTYTAPLFVSEFGIDQRGTNTNDNRFINCFMAFAAQTDIDWAYWPLQGSYYIRSGKPDLNETYGLLSFDWTRPRNASFLSRISLLQHPLQGPGLAQHCSYQMIYHPLSGLCLQLKRNLFFPLNEVILGRCSEADAWQYTSEKQIRLKQGTRVLPQCIQAVGIGEPPRLSFVDCILGKTSTQWEMTSTSGLHLSAKLENGSSVCLEGSFNSTSGSFSLVTENCKCLSRSAGSNCEPTSQWFAIVNSTATFASSVLYS